MVTRYHELSSPVKLDLRARKILALLATDGRQTDTRIAQRVRLSREAVHHRITRLGELGILQGIMPVVNLQAMGWQRYHFCLLIDERPRRTNELLSWLNRHPNTSSVMEFTDTWDLRWTIVARSIQEYDKIARDLQNAFGDILLDKQELASIAEYESSSLPRSFEPSILRPVHTTPPSQGSIDIHDKGILQALSRDGRASSRQIAQQVKLSNDAILLRMRKLKDSAVITRHTAACNLSAIGLHWYTLAVQFSRFTKQDEHQLQEFIIHNSHITHAERTFGPWSVIIEIVADPATFHKTVKLMKSSFSGFIKKYETWVAYKEHTFVPIPAIVTSPSADA